MFIVRSQIRYEDDYEVPSYEFGVCCQGITRCAKHHLPFAFTCDKDQELLCTKCLPAHSAHSSATPFANKADECKLKLESLKTSVEDLKSSLVKQANNLIRLNRIVLKENMKVTASLSNSINSIAQAAALQIQKQDEIWSKIMVNSHDQWVKEMHTVSQAIHSIHLLAAKITNQLIMCAKPDLGQEDQANIVSETLLLNQQVQGMKQHELIKSTIDIIGQQLLNDDSSFALDYKHITQQIVKMNISQPLSSLYISKKGPFYYWKGHTGTSVLTHHRDNSLVWYTYKILPKIQVPTALTWRIKQVDADAHISLGVVTEAVDHLSKHFVGFSKSSFGYLANNGHKYNENNEIYGETFAAGDLIEASVNENNELSFSKNGKSMGVAYTLPAKENLYFASSMCGHNADISVEIIQ